MASWSRALAQPATRGSIKFSRCSLVKTPVHSSLNVRIQASSSNQSLVPISAKNKLLGLIASGYGNYNGADELEVAIQALFNEVHVVPPSASSLAFGQGVWEVFYAPHIAKMSSLLRTKFEPIRYTFEGGKLVSNVQYTSFFGNGWLSAAGTMKAKDQESVEISFDRFWLDVGSDLRPDIDSSLSNVGDVDKFVSQAG